MIRYDEGAGTGIPKIRIRSLQTGEVDVEMIPGRLVRLPDPVAGIVITNLTGAAITGKITMGAGDVTDNSVVGTVDLGTGTLAALENIDLNAATTNTLTRPLQAGGTWSNTATLGAGAVNIFTAGANANGAIIHSAHAQDLSAGALMQSFLANATGPANVVDGEVIALSQYAPVTGNSIQNIAMTQAQRLPAGVGLYFYSSAAGSAGFARACRYTLL